MELIGRNYQDGENIRVVIKNGVIDCVYPHTTEKNLPYIAPGLVDLQLNGYQGVDLNGPALVPEDVRRMVHTLWEQGVTSFFPTVITNATEMISGSLRVIAAACDRFPEVAAAVLGIHLEGPFISKEDGPRGAHKTVFVKAPDWDLLMSWQQDSGNRIKLITLSPEWPDSNAFIEKCVRAGIKVAIGHTAASREQIKKGTAAGMTLSTHLGNGCHQVLPRYPNYIWNQLATDQLWSSLIADGIHLPEDVLRVFLKVKPDTSFLVSDATHLAGMPPGCYRTHIGSEVVLEEAGRLYMKDSPGHLAGSAKSLVWCVSHLVRTGILSLAQAWDLASLKPLAFLDDRQICPFEAGRPADLVLFQQTANGIQVAETIKSGKPVFTLNNI